MTKVPTRLTILQTAIDGQCPRCGARDLFETHFRLRKACPNCQLPLEQEDGWGLGAIPLNYTLTCIGWILPIGVLFLFGIIPIKASMIMAGLGAIIIPFLTFRCSKRLWIGIYYAVLPNELRIRDPNERGDVH